VVAIQTRELISPVLISTLFLRHALVFGVIGAGVLVELGVVGARVLVGL
jgi:hypothetical protein